MMHGWMDGWMDEWMDDHSNDTWTISHDHLKSILMEAYFTVKISMYYVHFINTSPTNYRTCAPFKPIVTFYCSWKFTIFFLPKTTKEIDK